MLMPKGISQCEPFSRGKFVLTPKFADFNLRMEKSMKNYEFYEHEPVYTIKELLEFCAKTYTGKEAFSYEENGHTISVTFEEFRQDVYAFGSSLFDDGFQNCHVAVFGENCYGWILTWFAVVCGGNVIVPIDKELDADSVIEILHDSECRAVIYSDTYADIAEQVREKKPALTYISMKELPVMIRRGRKLVADRHLELKKNKIKEKDLASIVYTSGTTGKSKGVMLAHGNFCSCMYGSCRNIKLTGTSLLILPLHHTYGLVAGVFIVMFHGMPIYINNSLKRLSDDLKKCSPQHLFVVPLIVETLYQNIWNTARKQGKDKLLRRMMKVSDALLRCGIDLRKVFFRSVIDALGRKLDLIVSGGAPIDDKYISAFRSLGITVLNGYGITECGPVVAVNRNHFIVPDSVGMPLCCNEVRISESGEILVKGSNVMLGYYHDEQENAKVFDGEWFKTGDIGFLDDYGALHITGRIKNLIILGNGENIPAEVIERAVLEISYVKEAVAYEQGNHIAVEVFLDDSVPDAGDKIHEDIRAVNRKLPHLQNIAQVLVRDTEFPKTTTKKIKRTH